MHRILLCGWVVCLSTFIAGSSSVSAQEWTRFRGPNGSGESETTTIPASWTDKDYLWRADLPGTGHSSPVLWGEKLFVMSADPTSATRYTLCYDASTGKKLWEKSFTSTPYALHKQSSYASGTPAVDKDHVYFAWAEPASITLIAFTHDGETVWKRDLGTWVSQHGFGTSPILYDHLVILSNSQEIKDAPEPVCAMLAVDRVTGKNVWSTKRHSSNTSYSVPAIFQPKKGKPQLVCTNTGDGIYALDPLTGKELWSNAVFDKRTVSSPLVHGDMIFGSTGSGGGGNYVVAVQSDGKNAKVAYKLDTQAPYVPTSVARGNLLFLMSDGGIATCVDIKTGNSHWRQRIGGNYSSSLVRANDKVYCPSMDGDIVVLAADKEFKELGRTSLGEPIRSTPAIANGRMYLRTVSQLMAIGGVAGSAAGTGN